MCGALVDLHAAVVQAWLCPSTATLTFFLPSLIAVVFENVREHNHVPVLFRKEMLGRAGEEVPAPYRELAQGCKLTDFSVSSGEVTFCPSFCR